MKNILEQNAKKFLQLPDGERVALIDMLSADKSIPWDDVNRNVYKISVTGDVIWQIGTRAAPSERVPFTNIYFDEDGCIRAYCWDGGEYVVDANNGGIDIGRLAK